MFKFRLEVPSACCPRPQNLIQKLANLVGEKSELVIEPMRLLEQIRFHNISTVND